MTTFLEYKNLIYKNIARDSNDALAVLVVPEAINYALAVAGILFKPPELFTSEDITLSAGATTATFSTAHIDLINLTDSTNSVELRFIPYESFALLKPTLTTVKYYSKYGTSIHVNVALASEITIAVEFIKYPATLTADADEPEFTQHDSFIVSAATAFTFAALEETDAVGMWSSMGEGFGAALSKAAQARELISGKPLQIESAITGVLSQMAGGG